MGLLGLPMTAAASPALKSGATTAITTTSNAVHFIVQDLRSSEFS